MGVDQMQPWTRRITDLLADGEWHDSGAIIAAAAAAVPPGIAYREGERDRQRKRPDGPGPRVRGDRQTSISVGAKKLVRRSLSNMSRNGRIDRTPDTRLVRMTAGTNG